MNTSSLSSHSYMGANNGYASPYSDRLYSPSSRGYLSPVGSKLDQIQPTSYYERNDEISDFERKIRVLDARVTVDSDLAKEKLKAGADQIGRLEQQMYNNTVLTNELNDKLTEDMKELQNGASMEVKIEEQTQKAVHQKMLKNFENKISNIKGEVGDTLRKARENMKTGRENIAKKVEILHEEIEKEKRIRQEENEKLINSISSRLNKVQEGLQRDRKLRQETQDMLLRSLEEMNKKLVLQVKIENENREKGEDQMIRLLELACNNFVPQRNEANTSIVGGLGLGLGLGLNGSFTSETKRVLMSNSQLY